MQWPFAQWGADAVMSGHAHDYERIVRDGIVYFVNGLGGASRYSFGTPVTGSAVRYNAEGGAQPRDSDRHQPDVRVLLGRRCAAGYLHRHRRICTVAYAHKRRHGNRDPDLHGNRDTSRDANRDTDPSDRFDRDHGVPERNLA